MLAIVKKQQHIVPKGTKMEVFHWFLRAKVANIARSTILECVLVDSRFCYSLTEASYLWYVDSS